MNTKKMFAMGAAAVALVMSSSAAFAVEGDTKNATANAGATIVTPISITKSADLQFGKIIPTTAGGTVTLTAASSGAVSGSGVSVSQGGTTTAAKFTVAGQNNYLYSITLPADSTITLSDGASHSMAVDTFTASRTLTGQTISSSAGANDFYVGATLTVGANQTAGAYTGTFSVSVAYD